MKGIAVVGSILVDKINNIEKYPNSGQLTKIKSVEKCVGGLVPNVGIDLKTIDKNLKVFAVGKVGNDDDGNFVVNKMKSAYLDTSFITYSNSLSTSFTSVMSEDKGERTFFTYAGASSEFGYDDIDFTNLKVKMLHLGYFLLLDKIDNGDGLKILQKAKSLGIKTSIDLVSENSDRYKLILPCLKYVDNLIINEIEASKLTGIKDENNLEGMCKALIDLGVNERVIIHKKEKSAIYSKKGFKTLPSIDIDKSLIKGKTGAGDAFCAGSLYAIYNDYSDSQLLDFASRCAVMNLTSANSIDGMKSKEEIYDFTKNFNYFK